MRGLRCRAYLRSTIWLGMVTVFVVGLEELGG